MNNVNVDGVVATLLFENLITTKDMRKYAKDRISGKSTYEIYIKKILEISKKGK